MENRKTSTYGELW